VPHAKDAMGAKEVRDRGYSLRAWRELSVLHFYSEFNMAEKLTVMFSEKCVTNGIFVKDTG